MRLVHLTISSRFAVIPLTRGKTAIVEANDLPVIESVRWCALKARNGRWYAHGWHKPTKRVIAMHRMLLGNPPRRMDVDHENRNGLDNRRANLRLCTRAQNSANCLSRGGASRFKGVTRRHENGRWQARLGTKKLGCYSTEEEAATAYDRAAAAKYGEFARLNFCARQQDAA